MESAGSHTEPAESAEITAHEIRITSHGKMSAWVDFALKFFEVLSGLSYANFYQAHFGPQRHVTIRVGKPRSASHISHSPGEVFCISTYRTTGDYL